MSNSIDLKKSNQNKVYRYIYENDGPVSKYDLMERLDLSLPTVNLILKHLTAEHYILEKGNFNSLGGRPPMFQPQQVAKLGNFGHVVLSLESRMEFPSVTKESC